MSQLIIHISHHNNPVFHLQINRVAQSGNHQTLFIIFNPQTKKFTFNQKPSQEMDNLVPLPDELDINTFIRWLQKIPPLQTQKMILLEANLGKPGHEQLSEWFKLLTDKMQNMHVIPFTSTNTCAANADIWYKNTYPETDIIIKANDQKNCLQQYLLSTHKTLQEIL